MNDKKNVCVGNSSIKNKITLSQEVLFDLSIAFSAFPFILSLFFTRFNSINIIKLTQEIQHLLSLRTTLVGFLSIVTQTESNHYILVLLVDAFFFVFGSKLLYTEPNIELNFMMAKCEVRSLSWKFEWQLFQPTFCLLEFYIAFSVITWHCYLFLESNTTFPSDSWQLFVFLCQQQKCKLNEKMCQTVLTSHARIDKIPTVHWMFRIYKWIIGVASFHWYSKKSNFSSNRRANLSLLQRSWLIKENSSANTRGESFFFKVFNRLFALQWRWAIIDTCNEYFKENKSQTDSSS